MKRFMLLLVFTQLLSGCAPIVWTTDNTGPLWPGGYGSMNYTCGQGIPYTGTMCKDPGSGSQADCGDVHTRQARRACNSSGSSTRQNRNSGQYPKVQVIYPRILWGKKKTLDEGMPKESTEKCPVLESPTTKNYLEPGAVDEYCQFKNPEMAGHCMLSKVTDLSNSQKQCNKAARSRGKIPKDPICDTDPGKWAKIYSCLGNDLVNRK